jgi:hypothetical protein
MTLNAYRIVAGKKLIGRPRSRWVDNTETSLKRDGMREVWPGLD